MNLFTATIQTQGAQPDDFCWCEPGEIVIPGAFLCSRAKKRSCCGCDRSLVGIDTSKSTVTFKVTDHEYTPSILASAIYNHWKRDGWTRANRETLEGINERFTRQRAGEIAEEMERASVAFDVDDIVGVRFDYGGVAKFALRSSAYR